MSNKEFYEKDEEFRDYVERYCKSRNVTTEEALTHKLVTIEREILISDRKYNGVIK